jgi:uncharacterized membrane protein
VFPFQVEPADFELSGLDAPETASAGDTIEVSATVSNVGGLQDNTKSVEFRVDLNGDGTLGAEETLASQEVTLAPGTSDTVTFDVDTSGLGAGTYTHGFVVPGDAELTDTIAIESQAQFNVTSLNAPATASQGSNVTVEATITNTGDTTNSSTVFFVLDVNQNGEFNDSEDVFVSTTTSSLAPGDSETATFEVSTADLTAGEAYEHGVTTATDAQLTTIDITESDGSAPIPSAYYDDSGVVTTSLLNQAVQDWAQGDIDTPTLNDIIQFWATGEDVTA